MNDSESNHHLLDELSADAPMRRMRSRLEELIAEPPRESRRWMPRLAWAAAAVILIAGSLAVWLRRPVPGAVPAQSQAVLEMLESPSTSERLRGVNAAADLPKSWPALRAALFDRLERDLSVNVRLSVLDVLLEHDLSAADSNRLISSLRAQRTAIVQAHLGHQLRRRRLLSRAELERVLQHREIHREARDALIRLEES